MGAVFMILITGKPVHFVVISAVWLNLILDPLWEGETSFWNVLALCLRKHFLVEIRKLEFDEEKF